MDNKEDIQMSDDESKTTIFTESYDQSVAFRVLEQDFTLVIEDLNRNDRLGHYAIEFQKVLDALRESRDKEKALIERNRILKDRVVADTAKLQAAAKLTQSDQEAIENLEQEVQKAWRMIDAAHTREQTAQETIENLRLQSARLTQELETLRKMGSDQDQEVGVLSKNKESMAREKERLLAEISHAREKYEIGLKYQEELERRNDLAEQKLAEFTTEIATHKSELAKEKRLKENLEKDIKDLRSDLLTKEEEVNHLTNQNTQSSKTIARMERHLREEKILSEKSVKELQELQNTLKLLKMEYEVLSGKLEEAQQHLGAKTQEIKQLEDDKARVRTEAKKIENLNTTLRNKLAVMGNDKGMLELATKEIQAKLKAAELEIINLKKTLLENTKTVQELRAQKEILMRNCQKCDALTGEQQKLISTQEINKKTLQEELQGQVELVVKLKSEVSSLQNEKDRLVGENLNLNSQIQDQIEKLKLKEMDLFNYKKRLAALDSKLKLQMAMYEQVRSERNQLNKTLVEKNDEISENKNRLKVKTYQTEQLKEDIRTKESLLVKDEFALKKAHKEKEDIKNELQKLSNELREKKELIGLLIQEEERLQKIIQDADKDKAKLQKDLQQVSNERDILGTQLVRRNDELALLYEKIKIFQSILQKGEAQYEQRLEDIRLLKIEIKKLRQEKAMLARSINNVADLRQELFHLERDFTRERLKCRALEEELQNPLNVHRWRKLEGSDPTMYELIQKIQILQKRLLAAGQEAIKKESQLKEMERLYIGLQELYAKKPGPEIHDQLKKCKSSLKNKGVKLKCLIAEMTMYEAQVSGLKFEKGQTDKAMFELKKKYLDLKRREQKVKQKEKELEQEKTFLPVLEPITGKPSKAKFVGAGFNIATAPCVARTVTLPMKA